MKNSLKGTLLAAGLSASLLSACGGAGSGGLLGLGIGGTGIQLAGIITAFGSVFVNGIEFEVPAGTVTVDGVSGVDTDLKLGMFVTIDGTVNDDGVTGTVTTIVFDDEVQGPISAISTDPDGTNKTLTILGVTVVVNQTSTVFDGTTFAALSVGDNVEISGLVDPVTGIISATRLESQGAFVPGDTEIELKGTVSGTAGTTFTLGSFTVDFSAADLSDLPGGMVTDGLAVEVKGTLAGTTISATQVKEEDELFSADVPNVSLQGVIASFTSASSFTVNGQAIDASAATLSPPTLILTDGVEVEVEGPIVAGVLVADSVELRGGDVRLEASVLSVDPIAGTITLTYATGTVVVNVDNQTQFRDDTDVVDPMTILDVSASDFLEVRAHVDGSGEVLASEIRRDSPDDDVLQAPIQSSVTGVSVTLLGLTFTTGPGTTFADTADAAITSGAFYGTIPVGTLVKIKDETVTDGVADEAELEL